MPDPCFFLFFIILIRGSFGIFFKVSSVEQSSRIIISLLMYCGRVGSMTFALAFTERKSAAHISLPEEKITVG